MKRIYKSIYIVVSKLKRNKYVEDISNKRFDNGFEKLNVKISNPSRYSVDYSSRLQTVSKESNSLYDILNEFENITKYQF